ncbi:retromer subunit VPS29 KNAG_0B03290 [Huiozyma naganishii CBS 8797]|uniref:Vacuolar protein sorting-associated protein 29 n=1 Tax=Huiozyma naganishii (strain ATCC MYA-139 / BCRC 22969 / CBS 8797 / KCTC 17520 / NBRC 10181 / NCYC 3082 / Yp74L-3) TaxID=1071383 RepID=J7S4S8_HUIN7|nr:hypothetical protein KNAG_0B03290 [Kazachstania naganishii CBS 8797]CCK68771.1 hypothetical protein KNAG_0B03290 [Kazachstania naganishii CBS 8797]
MLLLVLGDAYIPDRATDIPNKFKKLLSVPGKITQIAVLGNSTRSVEFMNFLQGLSPNMTKVKGALDEPNLSIGENGQATNQASESEAEMPINSVISMGDFKIGCCSGYSVVPKNDPLSLLALARQLDVDIMLWGGTHNVEAYTLSGKFFVNPGSCTGAFNSDWPVVINPGVVESEPSKKINDEPDKKAEEESQVSDEKVGNTEKTVKDNEAESETKEDTESVKEEDIDIPESAITGSNSPSFCLLDIQGSTCTLYIYIYIDNDVKVDKIVYRKEDVV